MRYKGTLACATRSFSMSYSGVAINCFGENTSSGRLFSWGREEARARANSASPPTNTHPPTRSLVCFTLCCYARSAFHIWHAAINFWRKHLLTQASGRLFSWGREEAGQSPPTPPALWCVVLGVATPDRHFTLARGNKLLEKTPPQRVSSPGEEKKPGPVPPPPPTPPWYVFLLCVAMLDRHFTWSRPHTRPW